MMKSFKKLSIILLLSTNFIFGISDLARKLNSGSSSLEIESRIQELKRYEEFIINLRKIFGTANEDEILRKIQNNKDNVMTAEQQRFILEVSRLLGTANTQTAVAIIRQLNEGQKDILNSKNVVECENERLKIENNKLKEEVSRVKKNYASQSELNSCKAEVQSLKDFIRSMSDNMKNRANR